jgi:hypothetical protein
LPVELPHFQAPFTFGAHGRVRVVEQDTPEEVAACCFNIASCPLGFRSDQPQFGVQDLAFSTAPVDTAGLAAEVSQSEPRAQLTVTESGGALDAALRTILMSVGVLQQ